MARLHCRAGTQEGVRLKSLSELWLEGFNGLQSKHYSFWPGQSTNYSPCFNAPNLFLPQSMTVCKPDGFKVWIC